MSSVPISIALVAGGLAVINPVLAFLRRRCEQTVPSSWLDEPPADPDIGAREPRRPRPNAGAGTVLLQPRCNPRPPPVCAPRAARRL